jgi:hypothetical protein
MRPSRGARARLCGSMRRRPRAGGARCCRRCRPAPATPRRRCRRPFGRTSAPSPGGVERHHGVCGGHTCTHLPYTGAPAWPTQGTGGVHTCALLHPTHMCGHTSAHPPPPTLKASWATDRSPENAGAPTRPGPAAADCPRPRSRVRAVTHDGSEQLPSPRANHAPVGPRAVASGRRQGRGGPRAASVACRGVWRGKADVRSAPPAPAPRASPAEGPVTAGEDGGRVPRTPPDGGGAREVPAGPGAAAVVA